MAKILHIFLITQLFHKIHPMRVPKSLEWFISKRSEHCPPPSTAITGGLVSSSVMVVMSRFLLGLERYHLLFYSQLCNRGTYNCEKSRTLFRKKFKKIPKKSPKKSLKIPKIPKSRTPFERVIYPSSATAVNMNIIRAQVTTWGKPHHAQSQAHPNFHCGVQCGPHNVHMSLQLQC